MDNSNGFKKEMESLKKQLTLFVESIEQSLYQTSQELTKIKHDTYFNEVYLNLSILF